MKYLGRHRIGNFQLDSEAKVCIMPKDDRMSLVPTKTSCPHDSGQIHRESTGT